ncbi:uncharacterized protein LOC114531613 isoform X2 [Dendronephthya gigantea]|nr:uncharacterized protein LOC114531613 isoform X2 [Dendronephthya gigantea]
MARSIKSPVCRIALLLLMYYGTVIETRDIVSERCEDQHGASLNENFALNKVATQSSTSNNGVASRLVDGNRNPYFGNNSCSETNTHNDVFWKVDLGTEVYVTSVTITTRADDYWLAKNNFSIQVLDASGTRLCASGLFAHNGESTTYACENVGKSSVVKIILDGNKKQLSLCEVEVYGYPSNFYENGVNFALRQPAKQSTIYQTHASAPEVVDGIRNTAYTFGSCTHTTQYGGDWWSVDLGVLVDVNAITVTNRGDAASSTLENFDIRIGRNWHPSKNPSCTKHPNLATGETRAIFCSRPMRGSYVGIVQKIKSALLFCEVSVHGREVSAITANEPVCFAPKPLGMEDHTILASQLKASSRFNPLTDASYARLNSIPNNVHAGTWHASMSDVVQPWIQVAFLWLAAVIEVQTQGRNGFAQWVKSFRISSSNDFVRYEPYSVHGSNGATTFPGNSDSDTVVSHRLQPVRVVRIVRLDVLSFEWAPTLRVEFVGCYYKDTAFPLPQALGIQSKAISDSLIDSSTELGPGYGRKLARLMGRVAWIPASGDTDPWIQINFVLMVTIVEILTQGRSIHNQWVKNYKVAFAQQPTIIRFYRENGVEKLFRGNTDRDTVVANALSPAIRAQYIRIYPKEYNDHRAMRLEFIGYYKDQEIGPLGLENKRIQDDQLSASALHYSSHSPNRGRLYDDKGWVAGSKSGEIWLQVDFLRLAKVSEIWTQGRGNYDQWIKTFRVQYSMDTTQFTTYKPFGRDEALTANTDRHSAVCQKILPAIEARVLRILSDQIHSYPALRMEVVGYYITYAASCYVRPLGMESREISDTQITASSSINGHFLPGGARLNFINAGAPRKGWRTLPGDRNAWLQVAFHQMVDIVEVQTQPRSSIEMFYNYTFSYGNNGVNFTTYTQDDVIKVFPGSRVPGTTIRHSLWPYITARFIRINAVSSTDSCGIKAEFIGAYQGIHGPELIDPEYVEFENTLYASSSKDWNHQPQHGIISRHFETTAWSPLKKEEGQYIQIDLLQLTTIAGVGFRLAGDRMADHYTKLMLMYGDVADSMKFFRDNAGNVKLFDTRYCYRRLERRVLARFVRFSIDSWETRPDFRFQLYETTEYSEAGAGIETGSIKDHQMKSSNHPNDPFAAHEGRLNAPRAWCGNPSRKKLYLQIDFIWNFEVHAVSTQGKTVGVMMYVTKYKLSSSLDGIYWNPYEEEQIVKIFTGNTDCRCIRKNPVQPFLARAVRFLPTAWKDAPCLRVEVFGVYKGILRVHARSGVLKGPKETIVTRKCSIKLNGKEVSRQLPGYNVAVVNPTTGSLNSSRSAEKASELNNLLMGIPDDSIVVVATQNVTQRPPNETLHLLESVGAIALRYSIESDHMMFLLVGYKGKRRVKWIKEKLGTAKDDIIRIAVPIKLNENEVKPEIDEQFVNANSNETTDSISLSGNKAYIFRNVTGRCGDNNTNCEMGFSLAMWMKQEPIDYMENVESPPTSERIDLQYYSNGYNYIVLPDKKTWNAARRYCLGIGGTLPVNHYHESLDYLLALSNRLVLGTFWFGLTIHPYVASYPEWMDGSPAVTTKWKLNEPSGLPEACAVETLTGLNDVVCEDTGYPRTVICQQPIQDLLGNDIIFPLGMEARLIPDASVTVSSAVVGAPGGFGRLNKNGNPWCALDTDENPYFQVDLGRLTRICAVATQGRGKDTSYLQYPEVFWLQMTNNSVNWTTLQHHDQIKYFRANYDNYGVVINRFPQPEIAQMIRINILKYFGAKLCMRIELFGCSTGPSEKQNIDPVLPPKSIPEDTPRSCLDVLMRGKTSDGVYMIDPDGRGAFPAFCDQSTDGGGWTVFQNRFDGSVDFNRIWDEYKWGFGDSYGEHWLGLEYISRITHAYAVDLQVNLKSAHGYYLVNNFHRFTISDEASGYTLSYSSRHGAKSDSLDVQKNRKFETKYNHGHHNKPALYGGAWWYGNAGTHSNLNGKYQTIPSVYLYTNMFWYKWENFISMVTTRMMLREGSSSIGSALGLEYHQVIQDYQIKSSFVDNTRPPTAGRLNHASFWSGSDTAGQFLSVNFISPRRITHISTQGGSDLKYVDLFSVKFRNLDGSIASYEENGKEKKFEGNNVASVANASAIVSNCFKEPVEATEIFVYALSCKGGGCSLRMELYACENTCSAPIGIQSSLPLDKLSSSESTSPMDDLRLFTSTPPWKGVHSSGSKYVEAKFPELFKVTTIATQGGEYVDGSVKGSCYVLNYYLMYLNEQMKWVTYGGRKPKILNGNRNRRSIVKNKLESPFLAHAVRVVRVKAFKRTCLKMEVYGCYPDNPSIVLHTETLVPGEDSKITGRYRYCPDCDKCPGCIKSICLRVFDKKYPVAEYFAHDCNYQNFDIQVKTSVTPGRHRVYLIESEYANCQTNKAANDERLVGSIYVRKEPSNCLELLLAGKTDSGKYFIDPDGKGSFEVYCDQSLFGGGWTVFQTRETDSPIFEPNTWLKYKSGFGELDGDFWLGNEMIHRLTTEKQELSLELQANTQDDVDFVLYKSFQVSNEEDGYRLHVAEYEPGSPAGDCLLLYDGVKFSSKDKNHDTPGCKRGFGWWFKGCSSCRLNGLTDPSQTKPERMKYISWSNKAYLKRAKMKVRARETVFCNEHYCYYLLKTWKNWFEASPECRRFNSDLVSIRDATENEWIRKKILTKLAVEKVHIGLKNTSWLDGGSFEFHNFSSNMQSELCPVLNSDGSWRYHDCALKARILCKRGKWCYRNRCHLYTDNFVDIDKNVKYCQDIGYKLSKIRNEEEMEYLKMINFASTDGSSWREVYFSLSLDSLRQPYWRDGKKVRSTFWRGNEPDEVSKKCGKLWSDGWADAVCNWGGNAICEKVYKEHPLDCLDLLLSGGTTSGIYTVDPDGMEPIKVFCDQETFGGGWTVLLRRIDNSLNFTDKGWEDYKNGFGALGNNFWLGNDNNHRLTKLKQEVLFDLESDNGDNGFALYKTFQVADEENLYNLTIKEYQTSYIGDAMADNNLMAFSTKDRDNDKSSDDNCALERLSGWWFNSCTQALLTGQYLFSEASKMISWKTWASNHGIKTADMKIRSSSAVTCNDKFCYYLTYTKKTWREALRECRNFNAELLSIHSEEENVLISGFIQPQAIDSVHLGLIASDYWSDGSPAKFSKLSASLPTGSCGSLEPNVNNWQVDDCNEPKRVVCKRGKHCFKGDCYFSAPVSTPAPVWSLCETYGWKPVKVSSRDEKEYLLKLVREYTADNSFPWPVNGLVYSSSDQDRVWPDGTMLRYNDWCCGEPNGGGGGEIYSCFSTAGFYDVPTAHQCVPFCEKAPTIKFCNEVKQKYDRSDSGVYAYEGKDSKTFGVHCELGSNDGPWLVFQRRVEKEPPTDFATQSWTSFKNGFGTKESNFWLGNQYIHEITWNNPHRLKIVIYSSDFNVYEAIYEDFYLGAEDSGYVINFGAYSGNAGDALSRHRGMQFSATGDDRSASGCTTSHPGGWWFENCLDSNLNGIFTEPSNAEGKIFWRTIRANILKTEMKIQPYDTKSSRVAQTVQGQTTSLSLTSKQDWMEVNLQTPSQQWIAHVLHPGPFPTHVSITWEESACLRYYENGIMLAEVPAMLHERPGYQYTSLSVFVDLPYLWLQRMKLWNEKISSSDAYSEYGMTEITFDNEEGLEWIHNRTSNYVWEIRQTCTPSNKTGACGDHTYHRNTGSFFNTEASWPAYPEDVAVIESPTFSYHYKCLLFWYHLYGRRMGTLSVYAKTNSHKRMLLVEIKGDIGNEWRSMQVDLEITEVFKIIFEATRGEGYQSDAAIDDISLTIEICKKECDPPCDPGKKCNYSSLQCVYDGIYDHLWSMDSSIKLFDDKRAFQSSVSNLIQIPGVVHNAVEYGSGGLAVFSDKCFMGICFPKYTLSFWFKYDSWSNNGDNILLSFGEYFKCFHRAGVPEDHLIVSTFVGLTRCEFEIFAPAKIWNHLIFVVGDDGNFTIYRNGQEVTNFTTACTENQYGPTSLLGATNVMLGTGAIFARNFAIDDLRLLFDALSVEDTLENYKIITGHNQSIWFQVNLTTIPWSEELSDDERDLFKTTAQHISDKVMATLRERSDIKSVHVQKFSHKSTLAEVEVLYDKVSYYDILSLEEAILVNKTCDGLEMYGIEVNSTSVPNVPPQNFTAVAINTTAISVSWAPVPSSNLNGVFQGYKVLYRKTNENNGYSEYLSTTIYAENNKELLQGLDIFTNYTLRVLAFTLSGDGFPTDPLIARTFDAEVTESPNMTVTNISSTALYVNWTMLPNSTVDYRQMLGYKMFYWKDAEEPEVFNVTFPPNTRQMLFENLEKWTTYCFTIAGFNTAGAGPNDTQCERTFEDAPEQAPLNVSAAQVTTSSIQIKWFPPPKSAVPGILRYYNISYRVLNISDSEVVELSVPVSTTTHLIEGLTGLLLCEINVTAYTVDVGPVQTIRVITNEGVPLAAPNITLVNTSSTSIAMNWTALPWAFHNGILLGYRIWLLKEETGGTFSQTEQTFSTNEFHKHLVNMSKWTNYCVRIAGYTAVGDGSQSATPECARTFEDAPEEPPNNLVAQDVSVTTIQVTWNPPPAVSVPGIIRFYNVTYRNLNYTRENLTAHQIGANDRPFMLANLHGLTLYEINVTAITILPGPWRTLHVLTQEGVPVIPPVNIMWRNLSSTSLNVSWNPPPPHLCNGIITGYNVSVWKRSEPQDVTNHTLSASEQVKLFEGLEKWTFYCGQIVAFTRIGEGPRSPVECIRTFEDEPEVSPRSMNGTNATWTSVYLTWDPIDPTFIPGVLRSYRVTYEVLDPEYEQFNHSYDGSILVDAQANSVNLTGLIGLTKYKVTVNGRTVKDGPIVQVNLKTVEGVPTSPPEEVAPTDVTPTTVSLTWKDIFLPERHGLIKGYELTYRKLEERSKREADKTLTFGADVHTAFLIKLVPYTNYSFTVAGYTAEGVGAKKHFVIETKEGVPNVSPKNSYGVNFTGPTTIFVGWGSLTKAELEGRLVGYEVRYRKFSVADEILQDPAPEMVKVVYSDINGIKLTGLETYTTYQVQVAAMSGGGRGVWSDILYVATCRCHKILTTNYWNFNPYTNVSVRNSYFGFIPYLLDMVTFSCCQNCLEHGTSEVDYFHDGQGKAPARDSDISVKTNITLSTDFSFPVYGFKGQTTYMKYYGYASIIETVGSVFFTLKPDYSLTQGGVLFDAVLTIVPFLAISVIFAYIAGVILWALECHHNENEYPPRFFAGASNGFWWAYITMTTVGYGDKTARTKAGRVFAVVWVLTGLCICSLLIGTISSAFTTSTTPPESKDIRIYGSTIAVLQDSPDHKLGVRRNAKVNTGNKKYTSVEELRDVLLSGTVDGILVDAYVADARKDLFSRSEFLVKKVIDVSSSYGVVMGTDAKKLRKCFSKFWKDNSAVRSDFIANNSSPVQVTDVSAEDITSQTYNPQTALYQITLYTCGVALIVLSLCGCVYEIIRRKRISVKVHCEKESAGVCNDLLSQTTVFADEIQKNIADLQRKQKKEILAFIKSQRSQEQKGRRIHCRNMAMVSIYSVAKLYRRNSTQQMVAYLVQLLQ